jgi:hypothetical protein
MRLHWSDQVSSLDHSASICINVHQKEEDNSEMVPGARVLLMVYDTMRRQRDALSWSHEHGPTNHSLKVLVSCWLGVNFSYWVSIPTTAVRVVRALTAQLICAQSGPIIH